MFLQRESIGEAFRDLYRKTKSPYIGVFVALRPALVVCDFQLARNILFKDFAHFHDHGFFCDEENDPLSGILFALQGEKWRHLRSRLSPAFSSGKLKMMFDSINGRGEPLTKLLGEKVKSGDVLQMQDILARYTTDIIASVAFGIEENSVSNPNSEFRAMGKKWFDPTLKNSLRNIMMFLYPSLMKVFRLRFATKEIEDFMISVISQTIDYREKNNVVRKDALQLLIELRKTGIIKREEDDSDDDNDEITMKNLPVPLIENKPLTIGEITAQAFVFFIGGFETASTAMAFCLYELAKNPRIQKRLQEEIDEVLSRHNYQITYESLMKMEYLEACIKETLRMYAPLPFLPRICTKEYKIPDSDVVIDEGTIVIVPIDGLQRDEKFFKDAETFNPDRFYREEQNPKEKPLWSFGAGPRICIGLKLGQMQIRIGLTTMLKDYSFELADTMHGELRYDPKVFISVFKKGVQLIVNKR